MEPGESLHPSTTMPAGVLARLQALQGRSAAADDDDTQPNGHSASGSGCSHMSGILGRLQQLQGRDSSAHDEEQQQHAGLCSSSSHNNGATSHGQGGASMSMSQRLSMLLDREQAAAGLVQECVAAPSASAAAAEHAHAHDATHALGPSSNGVINGEAPVLPDVMLRLQELRARENSGAQAAAHTAETSSTHTSAQHSAAGPSTLAQPTSHITSARQNEQDEGGMAAYLQRLQLLLQRPEPGDEPLGTSDAGLGQDHTSCGPAGAPGMPLGNADGIAHGSPDGIAHGSAADGGADGIALGSAGASPMSLGSPAEGHAAGAGAVGDGHSGGPRGSAGGAGSSGEEAHGLSVRLLELAARSMAAEQWAECAQQLQAAQQLGADSRDIARLSAMASVLQNSTDGDWQAVLELPEHATARDAQRSYRRLATLVHPDKAAGAAGVADTADAAFKALGQAYHTARRELQGPDGQPGMGMDMGGDDDEDGDTAWWRDWEDEVQQDGGPSSSGRPGTQPSDSDKDPVLWNMSLQELQVEVGRRQRAVLQPQSPEEASLPVAERQKRLRVARSALSERTSRGPLFDDAGRNEHAMAKEYGGGFVPHTSNADAAHVKRQRLDDFRYT